MSKLEKKSFDQWRFNYFGKNDTTNIKKLEKSGTENPEAFWCVAMAIRYINLLSGMREAKELREINSFLKPHLKLHSQKTKANKRVG